MNPSWGIGDHVVDKDDGWYWRDPGYYRSDYRLGPKLRDDFRGEDGKLHKGAKKGGKDEGKDKKEGKSDDKEKKD